MDTLDLVIAYGLNINILSVTGLALSDHHHSFDQSLQNTTERTIRKRYITPEVAKTLTSQTAAYNSTVLPSSCEDLVSDFNHGMKTALDAVAPL